MRKPLALLSVAVLMLALGVAFAATAVAGDPPVRAAATKTVKVTDNYFSPKRITVKKGTIVKFVWRAPEGESETYPHDVYSKKGTRLRSGIKTSGSYRKRIYKTTTYICRVHYDMRGKITVR